MGVDAKRFAADLERSNDAVLVVANWMLYELDLNPVIEETEHEGSDHGDIYVGGMRIEVKHRTGAEFRDFTSPADYPYGDILVCETYRYDNEQCHICGMPLPKPSAVINVNGDMTHAVVAYAATYDRWEKRERGDRRYDRNGFYYFAPFDACKFYDIRVD